MNSSCYDGDDSDTPIGHVCARTCGEGEPSEPKNPSISKLSFDPDRDKFRIDVRFVSAPSVGVNGELGERALVTRVKKGIGIGSR